MTGKPLTIGRAARKAGVGIETIRYYQRLGLIEEPPRPLEGYRLYSEQHIQRLRFIKRAQELGFTLREIATLLELGSGQCGETRELAQAKLEQIRRKIDDLRALSVHLQDLIDHCEQRKREEACPIISSLSAADTP